MRIKIIKDTRYHRKGEILQVSPNEGFGMIDSGVAIVTKDMVPDDYKQAGDKYGSTSKLRTNNAK